jgi:uncharacterized membrane protein
VTARRRRDRKRNRLQAFFVRGLITVLPILFTVFILLTAFRFVDGYVTGPVNSVIYWALEKNGAGWQALEMLGIDPHAPPFLADRFPRRLQERLASRSLTSEDPEYFELIEEWRSDEERFLKDFEKLAIDEDSLHKAVVLRIPPLVGLVVSVLLVLTLGSLAGGFLGRSMLLRGERFFAKIPLVRSIYPYAKQLVDFFLAERSFDFDTVVAVPYPRHGLYSMGFVTSSAMKTLRKASGDNLISLFIPSSPMPMTGYTIFVPVEDVVPLPITVDEALRTIVSGGVLIPPHERVPISVEEVLAEAHGSAARERPDLPPAATTRAQRPAAREDDE